MTTPMAGHDRRLEAGNCAERVRRRAVALVEERRLGRAWTVALAADPEDRPEVLRILLASRVSTFPDSQRWRA